MSDLLISTLLQFWYISATIVLAVLAYFWYAQQSYYIRGFRAVRRFFAANIIHFDTRTKDNWDSRIKNLKDRIYNLVLEADHTKLVEERDRIESAIHILEATISQLENERNSIMRGEIPQAPGASMNGIESESDEIVASIGALENEINVLEQQLRTYSQQRISGLDVTRGTNSRGYFVERIDHIVQNVSQLSKSMHRYWLLFGMLVLDYGLALYFFYRLSQSLSLSGSHWLLVFIIGWLLPLGLTFLVMYLLHIFFTKRREGMSRLVDDFWWLLASGMVILGLWAYRIGVLVSTGASIVILGLEIVLLLFFTTLVFLLGYVTASNDEPNLGRDINFADISWANFVSVPFLLVFNALALLIVIPVSALEMIVRWIRGILHDDRSDSEREAQKKITELKKRREDEKERLNTIRKEEGNLRKEAINSRATEYLENQKTKIQDIDKDISGKQESITKITLVLHRIKNNLSELRKGSDDGVLYGLSKYQARHARNEKQAASLKSRRTTKNKTG